MSQRDPQGPRGPQAQGGPQGFQPGQFTGAQEQRPTGPALRWVRLDNPMAMLPIGEDEEVLDTVYNPQFNAWEVLVRTPAEDGQ